MKTLGIQSLHAESRRLVVHVSTVATVEADGFTVQADGERRTQHRHDVANVSRSDDMLEHGALVGGLAERLDGCASRCACSA